MMQLMAETISILHADAMVILIRIFFMGLILMTGLNMALCRGIGRALGKQDPSTA